MIFNNAARLHVGKRERLGQILEPSRFYNFLFVNLAVKVDDRSIRPNRPRLDAVYVLYTLDERNLHVPVLSAFFREDLLPDVIELVRGPAYAVVPVNLTVKNDCGSPGRFWIAGHFQFFLRDWLPFVTGNYRLREAH